MVEVGLWGFVLGVLVLLAQAPWTALHQWAELCAVRWLEVGGPTFVKLGQWLATRRDMFSETACQALSRLHTDVHSSFQAKDKAESIALAKRACGVEIDTEQLVGQGCLGTVYMARLVDGSRAVAKILRPGVAQRLQDDIEILRFFVHRIVDLFPSTENLALNEAIDIFGFWMNAQSDLTVEAKQLDHFRSNFSHHRNISCPKVHYASEDVLVMDFVEGKPLAHLLRENPRSAFIQEHADDLHATLGGMMGHMLIQDNFVHQDLHPGNIVLEQTEAHAGLADWIPRSELLKEYMPRWLRSTLEVHIQKAVPFRLHILDAGLAVQMEPEESTFFKDMIKACYRRDPIAAGETAYQLHYRHGRTSSNTVREDFVEDIGGLLLMSVADVPEKEYLRVFPDRHSYWKAGLNEYLEKFLTRFRNHGVRMEPSIWSILCSFALLEGTMRELHVGVDGLQATLPYVFDLRGNIKAWLRHRQAAVMHLIRPAVSVAT